MPKKPNAKKMAARAYGNNVELSRALDGEYYIGKVVKALGNCQFETSMYTAKGPVTVTALVRGKYKGGKGCATHVTRDCYVAIQGDVEDIMEIMVVINQQDQLNALREAGRIPEGEAKSAPEGFAYESESEEEGTTEGDIWVKAEDADTHALVGELSSRYLRASKAKAHAKAKREAEMASRPGPAPFIRKPKARPPARSAAGGGAPAEAEEKPLDLPVKACWEDDDEIDIDAI